MWFKNFLKCHFLILKVRGRFSAQVQIAQRQLFHYYQDRIHNGRFLPLSDTGYRVFSQFEEDGILLYIFAALSMGTKTFVEIGSDDGINSNCANLAFNFGWSGVFIDSNRESIARGKRFYARYPHPWTVQPTFVCASVTPQNINHILTESGVYGEIELLSIDIDGDDYWIWNAIEVIRPKVVIIETHVRFGFHNIVVPYGRQNAPDFEEHHGASPVAMVKLAQKKGYRLVGANQLGFNLIFIDRRYTPDALPEVTCEDILQHPSAQKSMQAFDRLTTKEYVTPIL